METQRFADPATAAIYPLPIADQASWDVAPEVTRWRLELPQLEAGSILTPSFSFLAPSEGYYVWRLVTPRQTWALQAVPSQPRSADHSSETRAAPPGAEPVSCHIDCFHIHETLGRASLELEFHSPPPRRYLLTISARPIDLADVSVPRHAAALALAPPALTQMTADPGIARRICSPTCVAMVMAYWDGQRQHRHNGAAGATVAPPGGGMREAMAAACHDPATGMYGIWPLAIRAAAGLGRLGAVELFADWTAALRVLAAGVPLVASIRFGEGQLADAPLQQTGGHLVVLHAAAPDYVQVNDPAAADESSVPRRYPADAFSRAWLSHRGAAYILLP